MKTTLFDMAKRTRESDKAANLSRCIIATVMRESHARLHAVEYHFALVEKEEEGRGKGRNEKREAHTSRKSRQSLKNVATVVIRLQFPRLFLGHELMPPA